MIITQCSENVILTGVLVAVNVIMTMILLSYTVTCGCSV